ncbi:hypothetical protein C7N43_38580 [Sphingobacteriales bacterium UPWRP_1]|nr:hypothetical protein B6N25_14310 [Sphingobacteriales bacterium TSM_CSS]PSJ71583.1 hypothetical protein C7N43_38580 [Sphingobacteriales bacterium UPWRP_1]
MSQHPVVPTPGSHIIQQVNTLIQTGNKILQQSEGSYSAKIRRDQPTALVFLIDQSGSMSGGSLVINGVTMNKAHAAALIINTALDELLKKSTKDKELRNYIDFAIIGYGKEGTASMAWTGKLSGKTWVTTEELGEHANKTTISHKVVFPDGSFEEETRQVKSWFNPVSSGNTPMLSAIRLATDLINQWIGSHPSSYPPVVINITDGEATDAKPPQLLEAAEKLKQLRTNDGKVLFLNCNLSSAAGASVIFPSDKAELPQNNYAHLLFDMSSVMPEKYRVEIEQAKKTVSGANYKGMTFNADGSLLVQFITIGSSY